MMVMVMMMMRRRRGRAVQFTMASALTTRVCVLRLDWRADLGRTVSEAHLMTKLAAARKDGAKSEAKPGASVQI